MDKSNIGKKEGIFGSGGLRSAWTAAYALMAVVFCLLLLMFFGVVDFRTYISVFGLCIPVVAIIFGAILADMTIKENNARWEEQFRLQHQPMLCIDRFAEGGMTPNGNVVFVFLKNIGAGPAHHILVSPYNIPITVMASGETKQLQVNIPTSETYVVNIRLAYLDLQEKEWHQTLTFVYSENHISDVDFSVPVLESSD